MNKRNRNIFFIILTLICVGLTQSYWLNSTIQLEWTHKVNKKAHYCFQYRETPHSPYKEENSIRCEANKIDEKLTINIPVAQLSGLRLTIKTKQAGRMAFGDMRLLCQEGRLPVISEKDVWENVKRVQRKGENIELSATAPSASVQCATNFHASPKIVLNYPNLFISILCGAWFSYVILAMIQNRGKTHAPHRTPKLANIEFLRIFFTLGVVAHHIFVLPAFKIYCRGCYGVEFFFLLSGYLLMITYNPQRSILDFARQKLIRFIPLVIFGGILCGAGWSAFSGDFMLGTLGLQGSLKMSNSPAWYIAVLFALSCIYFYIIKTFNSRQRNLIIALTTYAAYIWLAQSTVPGVRGFKISPFYLCCLLRGIAGMGLGILLAQICVRKEGQEFNHKTKFLYSGLELGVLGYVILGTFCQSVHPQTWVYVPISHAILLWLFVQKKGYVSGFFEHALSAKLAKYCLGIYLTHCAIYTQLIPRLSPDLIQNHRWEVISAGIALACGLGVLAHYFVEKPAVKLLAKRSA